MFPFQFSKPRAQQILNSVREGKPIAPEDSGRWNALDAMQAAGALLYLTICRGPDFYRNALAHAGLALPADKMTSEQREAADAGFPTELGKAFLAAAQMTSDVEEGTYAHPDVLRALLHWDDEDGSLGLELLPDPPEKGPQEPLAG